MPLALLDIAGNTLLGGSPFETISRRAGRVKQANRGAIPPDRKFLRLVHKITELFDDNHLIEAAEAKIGDMGIIDRPSDMKNLAPIIALLLLFVLPGCASASPIDFLVPAKRPSPATEEYLGHLYQTNYVANGLYYSVSDAKMHKAFVPVRRMELEGLHAAAKGEMEIIDAIGSKLSNGIWGGLMGIAALAGWQLPSPREKAKVTEALYKAPPVSNDGDGKVAE